MSARTTAELEQSEAPELAFVTSRRPHLAVDQWLRSPVWVLAALLAIGAAALLYAGRHLTFFYDEWTFALTRRGSTLGAYLDPHNGHLSLFPAAVYKLLFAIFGLRHYTPYRVVGIALHLVCCGLLYVLARRRVGPWLALVPVALLLFLGSAFQDLLWPFQMGYLGSVAAGLAALALLDRPSPRSDGCATLCLVWSVASSGVGIPFVFACAMLLLVGRRRWRALWIVAIPLVLYAAWYAGWGQGDQTSSDAILGAPQYVANAAAGAAAGIAGLDSGTWGPPLAVAFCALVAVAWRGQRRAGPSPMLLAAATAAVAFWALTAVTRAAEAEPAASRYVYVGAVLLLLIASEARVGVGVRPAYLALAAVAAAGALVSNVGLLRAGERGLRASDTSVRASLAATQIAAPVVSPAFKPDSVNAPQLTAGGYFGVIRDLGSPAFTVTELERGPELVRERADQVLEYAERLSITPVQLRAVTGTPPHVAAVVGGRARSAAACESFIPTSPLVSVDLRLLPGSALVVSAGAGAPLKVYLRRFASTFPGDPNFTVADNRAAQLVFPRDGSPLLTWQIQLVSARPLIACAR